MKPLNKGGGEIKLRRLDFLLKVGAAAATGAGSGLSGRHFP